MTQLALELETPTPNPNEWMFHPDGTMRVLLWPGDDVRMMHDRDRGGGYAVPFAERRIHGCCTGDCPLCNPDAYRCAFGCCPPIREAA